MKVGKWLVDAEHKLRVADVDTARLDCLVILEDLLGIDRAHVLSDQDMELSNSQLHELMALLERRSNHVPLAYIRQKTEFFGREFYVDERVLEPRPESEAIISILKSLQLKAPSIADIGTGSGVLGITAALEVQPSDVTLLDIDPKALEVAKVNAVHYKVKTNFMQSDLLDTSDTMYDILLCNLPYVPDSFQINTAATHEPSHAIFGGIDGLDVYRKLFEQLERRADSPSYVITESMPSSHHQLASLARSHKYYLETTDGFVQLFGR